jgi:hypothetical protein
MKHFISPKFFFPPKLCRVSHAVFKWQKIKAVVVGWGMRGLEVFMYVTLIFSFLHVLTLRPFVIYVIYVAYVIHKQGMA